MKKEIKEFIMITVGIVLVGIGVYYFLVAGDLATGGVSGLALVISHYFPRLSIGLLMLIMNIVLFIIAFILIGPNFGAKTIYASLGLSGVIWAFEKFMPLSKPVTNQPLLLLIYGILISGAGLAIVFNQNASTGGTDIVAKILNKFFHVDMGKAMMMADFLITLAAGLTFGIEKGMYALLGVILNGVIIDTAIEGFNMRKQVTIISSKGDEIRDFIMKELQRGVTIYEARGAYTGEGKEVLITIMDRKEFIKLKNYIKEVDYNAFITVSNVHEVLGQGFKSIED